ncbi:MAG: TetR/AcrR family transcriptional regulator [Hamadaea sp.]|uniref:TetR/AcrR family transcriptional regulator n=1 Tax=Hamadaea sp. TaxID=2024425 RepID=UPI0017F7BC99|nr:TetR/AcrR family transcriptional regulator [Hamadaea sp.]NUR48217.1 TetR/AcrR family transcriptional regulator [Hamadaea sp.]NUR73299.1 TetR/AcrR family transcriptional regulator [Hamadaea sp.]NUT21522.1 TetR/AcrR family transcriptional regulator [Hamadaea sp.]
MEEKASRERVLEAATRLFAERGYDGTSTREIGRASGLNIATVAYHVGAKADLYREVMRHAYELERAALTGAIEEMRAEPDPVAGLQSLVGRYLDFCLANPHVPALWMRRWLADAADVTGLEQEYAWPLIDLVRDAIEIHDDMTLWTVMWSIHGFVQAGVLDADGKRHVHDLATVARYRAHLDGLVKKLVTQ